MSEDAHSYGKQGLRVSVDLALPLDAVTQTFGVLAVRGAGKSNLAAVMAEEMFRAALAFVVVDPVGAWWGLRSSADGKGPGLAIPIFGGRRGDVPLERTGGQLIADLVVDQNFSCVLDVSEFSEGDKTRFLIDFAERLYRRNETPRHLFLEEADDYAPQRPFREQARLLHAWEQIVRRGRARGLGITMITQRSAALNKNVLTQIETLFVLRTTSPQDRKAIEGWVEYHGQGRELLRSLPELASGEAWVWSPHWLGALKRIKANRRSTFDSGATPKDARRVRPAATMADVDLDAVRQEMAATIERAKADDPKELHRRIAELDRELRQAKAATPAPERIEVPVLSAGDVERLERSVEALSAEVSRLRQLVAPALAARPASQPRSAPTATVCNVPNNPDSRRALATVAKAAAGLLALSGPEQRIVDAIAWMESIGASEPEQSAVAFLAGYTIGGGAWNNPRGSLRTKGLIEYRGDCLALTELGRAAANAPDTPLTTEELHRRVMERLPGPERKILQVLLDHYPQAVANDELARLAGYEPGGGAYNNPRGRLRSLGLVEYPERGMVVARGILFPA